MTRYIFSTSSTSIEYVEYQKEVPGNIPQIKWRFTVAGGANVANKHLVTPRGVATPIDDANFDIIQHNEKFKEHVAKGFVAVSGSKNDLDIVVDSMEKGDASRPFTKADYEPGGRAHRAAQRAGATPLAAPKVVPATLG